MPARRHTPDEAALARVLDFAQADLATWREGDWLNALEDVPVIRVARPPSPTVLRAHIKTAHQAVREVLEALSGMREAVDAGQVPKPLLVPLQGLLRVMWPPDGRGPFVRDPEMREAGSSIKARMVDLLTRVDAERLRRCRECGRWFVAVRRTQDYDTPACGNRRRVRLFQQRQRRGKRVSRKGARHLS